MFDQAHSHLVLGIAAERTHPRCKIVMFLTSMLGGVRIFEMKGCYHHEIVLLDISDR